MTSLFSSAIANINTFVKKLHLERFLSVVLVVSVFLATYSSSNPSDIPIGERIGEKQHRESVNSERPKTTGEFLDEARGDIPLGKRLKNITRDTKEAVDQYNKGIGNSIKESARDVKNAVTGQ